LNNSAAAVIELLKLPVRNVLGGVQKNEFFCSGALLRVDIPDRNRLAVLGLVRAPIVMFEQGPSFEPKATFQGAILASYPRNRSPLASGFAVHAERIQGKAAALEVNLGKGRIYLYGFKPQWRGQTHGSYKFVFNVLYEYQESANKNGNDEPLSSMSERWGRLADAVRLGVANVMDANHRFVTAQGKNALAQSSQLDLSIRQLRDGPLTSIEELTKEVQERETVKYMSEYTSQVRRLLTDATFKDLGEGNATLDRLLSEYDLLVLEDDIEKSMKVALAEPASR
jgi:hypothetical protein